MKEIEVKAQVSDSFVELRLVLERLGAVLQKEVQQNDAIFLPKGLGFGDIVWGMPVLRIREENEKTLFTIKQKSKNLLSAIELETHIDNALDFARMLDLMNYAAVLEVRKHRCLYKYKELAICLDEVEGLGTFIELEKMADETADEAAIQSELWQFLTQLGVKEEDRVTKGYDNLLWKKKQLAVQR